MPLISSQEDLIKLLIDRSRDEVAFRLAPNSDLIIDRPAHNGSPVHLYGPHPLTAVVAGTVHVRDVRGGSLHVGDDTDVRAVTGGGTVYAYGNATVGDVRGGTLRATCNVEVEVVYDGTVHATEASRVTTVKGGTVNADGSSSAARPSPSRCAAAE